MFFIYYISNTYIYIIINVLKIYIMIMWFWGTCNSNGEKIAILIWLKIKAWLWLWLEARRIGLKLLVSYIFLLRIFISWLTSLLNEFTQIFVAFKKKLKIFLIQCQPRINWETNFSFNHHLPYIRVCLKN